MKKTVYITVPITFINGSIVPPTPERLIALQSPDDTSVFALAVEMSDGSTPVLKHDGDLAKIVSDKFTLEAPISCQQGSVKISVPVEARYVDSYEDFFGYKECDFVISPCSMSGNLVQGNLLISVDNVIFKSFPFAGWTSESDKQWGVNQFHKQV